MPLYHLFEKDTSPKDKRNDIGTWDTYDSFVIRAESKRGARALASEEGGELWKDPVYTDCIELHSNGESKVIIGSYNAG